MSPDDDHLAQLDRLDRLDRLEAAEQIRQLAARYALALDSRNVPDLVALFVDDVRTGDGGVGRDALAAWFDPILRPYGITFHLIGNHIIDFVDDDNASGVVYCRPEHEVAGEWIVMPMQYWDRYVRRAGRWYFKSRSVHPFYAAHVTQNPGEVEGRYHFPNNPLVTKADLPERWESWQRFWSAQQVQP